jgi:hypothetical protein
MTRPLLPLSKRRKMIKPPQLLRRRQRMMPLPSRGSRKRRHLPLRRGLMTRLLQLLLSLFRRSWRQRQRLLLRRRRN